MSGARKNVFKQYLYSLLRPTTSRLNSRVTPTVKIMVNNYILNSLRVPLNEP